VWQESRGPVPGPITNGNLLDAAGTYPPLPRSDRPGAALAANRSPLCAPCRPGGCWQRLLLAAAAARLLVTAYSEHSRGTASTHGVLRALAGTPSTCGVLGGTIRVLTGYSRGTHSRGTHGARPCPSAASTAAGRCSGVRSSTSTRTAATSRLAYGVLTATRVLGVLSPSQGGSEYSHGARRRGATAPARSPHLRRDLQEFADALTAAPPPPGTTCGRGADVHGEDQDRSILAAHGEPGGALVAAQRWLSVVLPSGRRPPAPGGSAPARPSAGPIRAAAAVGRRRKLGACNGSRSATSAPGLRRCASQCASQCALWQPEWAGASGSRARRGSLLAVARSLAGGCGGLGLRSRPGVVSDPTGVLSFQWQCPAWACAPSSHPYRGPSAS
jgi:hypothetical protein